jgi:hypothetical protein
MSERVLGISDWSIQRGYRQGTYVHLGRKAASTLAPEGPSSFQLRSAEIMEISMVAGWIPGVVAPKVSLVSVLCIIIIIIMKSEHAYPVCSLS